MPRVLQLTDSHLMQRPPSVPPAEFADAVHLLTGRTSAEAADAVCAAVRDAPTPVDLVLHTGDICDEMTVGSYEAASMLVAGFDVPALVTPGNHDDPALVKEVFRDRAALTTASVDLDGWRVILASSWADRSQSGTFSDETLAELAELLTFDGPVLIGTHHPPLTPCAHPDCINDRSAEFLSLLDGHPNVRAVVSGHLHVDDEILRRGVRHWVTPSTALQLRHVHPLEANNTAATDGGARILDLHPDGTITTEVVWA